VRPSSSVDKHRNQSVDPQKVAQELSVDTLLTGGYIKDGDDLRITAQLIDIKSNRMRWQDAIDVKFDKLLTVQDRVTQEIVKGLELNLTAAETQRLKPDNRVDPLAYEDYLRGVDLYSSNDLWVPLRCSRSLFRSIPLMRRHGRTWDEPIGRMRRSKREARAV
jgi:adenylate cyclase